MKLSPSPSPPSGVTPAPGLPSTQERLRECAPVRITSDGSRVRLERSTSSVEVSPIQLMIGGRFWLKSSEDGLVAWMLDGDDLVAMVRRRDVVGGWRHVWRAAWGPIARGEALEVAIDAPPPTPTPTPRGCDVAF